MFRWWDNLIFRLGMLMLLVALSVAACGDVVESTPTPSPVAAAREVLSTYFSLLQQGHYEEAVAYYGGDYAALRDWNPSVDPADDAGLLGAGCEVNGLQCLAVDAIVAEGQVMTDEFIFTVQFADADGNLFVTDDGGVARSEFTYTVRRREGSFVVMELPVYVS